MTTIAWLVALVVCFALGIVLGRFMAPGTEKARRLEQERDEARAELKRYRDDVRSHFEKTASLFNQVTGTYRQLYEHLAEGSERLGTGESARLLEREPEYRTLRSPEEAEQGDAAESDEPDPAAAGKTEEDAAGAVESDAQTTASEQAETQPQADDSDAQRQDAVEAEPAQQKPGQSRRD